MASADPTQRHYRAPCPGCGAAVPFRSAQCTHAVCGYCQSTVVRSGEVLARLGRMAELFDDHSPLQLLATGRIRQGARELAFTLIGRLQYRSETGVWTEWVALLEDASMANLCEDNGAYVFMRRIAPGRALPEAARFRLGRTTAINGRRYSVAYVGQARLIAAQGELSWLPPLDAPFDMVALRSADGQLLTIDYGHQPPEVERGHSVRLEDLQLSGLTRESAHTGCARQFNCPQCGAPVQVQLAHTRSITCAACASIIDLDGGVGGELRAALQDEPVCPLIAPGSRGRLQGTLWQVVGFAHRMGVVHGAHGHFGWSEYLLYNRERGFAFLLDSEQGWSMLRATTGAPRLAPDARSASYLGTRYQLKYSYQAETGYVLGEFYWHVTRGQKSTNRAFASRTGLLTMEQGANAIGWFSGDRLGGDSVARAFGLEEKKDLFQRPGAGPLASHAQPGWASIVLLALLLAGLLMLLSHCAQIPGAGYHSAGGLADRDSCDAAQMRAERNGKPTRQTLQGEIAP